MRVLKTIHYADNSLEATWLDVATDETSVQVRCHSYADVQMAMFRADVATYGGTVDEALVAQIEAAIVPYVAPPPVVPFAVSPRQIRMALTRAGLRTSVETAVAAGDQDLKDWWEFSTTFERVNPQVTAMAAALGVDDAGLDGLWTLAGSL